jgi:hypothetical protein
MPDCKTNVVFDDGHAKTEAISKVMGNCTNPSDKDWFDPHWPKHLYDYGNDCYTFWNGQGNPVLVDLDDNQ